MILNVSFNFLGMNVSVYGLLMAVGFIVAFFVCNYLFKKSGEFKKDITFDLLLIIFPLSILGARIYYCVFSEVDFSFVEFLQIWNGGLAIYGGIIGGFIGVLIYAIAKKINILKLTDVIASGLILAQGIGRIGCYFGGCCYGVEVTNPSLMWFPFSVMIDGTWHYSTFFYESAWNFLGFIILFIVYNKTKQVGLTTGAYLCFYGLGRFFIEGLRGDSLFIGTLRVSQILSIVLFFVGIGLICFSLWRKKTKNEQKQAS